jgi:hypothetical protein
LFEQIKHFDPIGIFFFVPSMVCLVLALQWGGTTYPWSAPRIIGLFVAFAVLSILFIIVEVLLPETAMTPMRVVLNRSVAGSMTYTFLLAGGMMTIIYYLAIWFQATKGDSAIHAGISTIPLVLSLVVMSIISAAITERIGYYVPAMLLSCLMCAVGAGLLSTLKPRSNHSYWIGYQVLYGLGIGCGFQQSNLSVQTVLPRKDVPVSHDPVQYFPQSLLGVICFHAYSTKSITIVCKMKLTTHHQLGLAIMFLQQQLGGSVFLSVAQSIFSSNLVHKLSRVAGLDPEVIVNTGATDLRNVVPSSELDIVVSAYSYALTRTFIMATILSACMIVGPAVVEWRSIKPKKVFKNASNA